MVNPQRSGWRSVTRLCTCGLMELERSVFAICQPIAGGGHPMAKYYWKVRLSHSGIF
jgi:hypothetical protein